MKKFDLIVHCKGDNKIMSYFLQNIKNNYIGEFINDLSFYSDDMNDNYFYSKQDYSFNKIYFKPRLGAIKKDNFIFDLATLESWSYKWYQLSKLVDGKLIVNTYNYSKTTNKHISLLEDCLYRSNIKFISISTSVGLQSSRWKKVALSENSKYINIIIKLIRKKGSRKITNERRKAYIKELLLDRKIIHSIKENNCAKEN